MSAGDPAGDRLVDAVLGETVGAIFENLYAAYAGEARNVAIAFLGEPALAEDAMHNAFLEVLRLLLAGITWSDPHQARAAVLRHTRWAALKTIRRRRRGSRREPPAAEDEGDPAAWARSEARGLCEHIVALLSRSHRTALHLRFVEGLSSAEAARRAGISVSAYEVRLHRALKAARAAAREMGVTPALWPLLAGTPRDLRPWRDATSRRQRASLRRAGRAAIAGAASGLLVGLAARAVPPPSFGGIDLRATPTTVTAARAPQTADAPELEDAVLTDAVAVGGAGPAASVVALGRGRVCECVEVFHTSDGGASWSAIRLPLQIGPSARLDVRPKYPTDGHIVLHDGLGHAWVSAGFGQPFATMSGRPSSSSSRHPVECSRTQQHLLCRGLTIGAVPDDTGNRVLPLGASRWLFLRPFAGVLCSADDGRHWQVRCPA